MYTYDKNTTKIDQGNNTDKQKRQEKAAEVYEGICSVKYVVLLKKIVFKWNKNTNKRRYDPSFQQYSNYHWCSWLYPSKTFHLLQGVMDLTWSSYHERHISYIFSHIQSMVPGRLCASHSLRNWVSQFTSDIEAFKTLLGLCFPRSQGRI